MEDNSHDVGIRFPLHQAVLNKDAEEVERLIKDGFDIYQEDEIGRTPVDYMNSRPNSAVIRLFVTHKDYISRNCTETFTPFHLMAKSGYADICEEHLKKGVNKNILGGAFELAYEMGREEVCDLLVEYGAKNTPFKERRKREAAEKRLKEMHNELRPIPFRYGEELLHHASIYGHAEYIEKLLEGNENVNAVNDNGETALHWACFGLEKDAVLALCDNGADVNVQDRNGVSPLHYAAGAHIVASYRNDSIYFNESYFVNIVEWYKRYPYWSSHIFRKSLPPENWVNIIYGMDYEENSELSNLQRCLLFNEMYAPEYKQALGDTFQNVEKLSLCATNTLIIYGAEANSRTTKGHTPLHWAVYARHNENCQLLVSAGADIYAEAADGKTPIDMAKDAGIKLV